MLHLIDVPVSARFGAEMESADVREAVAATYGLEETYMLTKGPLLSSFAKPSMRTTWHSEGCRIFSGPCVLRAKL
jgi:hypothetical protein